MSKDIRFVGHPNIFMNKSRVPLYKYPRWGNDCLILKHSKLQLKVKNV